MIGGADENEAEAQPSTRTATQPCPPSPLIATPSSPLQGTGLARRLLGSIRALALALPTPPPAAAPKVGLGLLLHLRPDHPSLHPATPSASEDPLEEDAAAARTDASAGSRSPVSRYRIADAAATSASTNSTLAKRAPHLLQHLTPAADTAGDQESGLVDGQQANEFRAGDESRPALVASPSEDEPIATDVSSASKEDDPLEDAAEWPQATQGDAARSAPFRQSPANRAPDLPRYLNPDTAGDLALEDHDAAAGDDQEGNVLQQCTGDRLRAAKDDQEVVQQGAIHPRDETTYDISAEDQEKVGSAENVDDVEGQELVEQDAIDKKGEGTDVTAAEDQDKAVEQCDTYLNLHTSGDLALEYHDAAAGDDQEDNVLQQCTGDRLRAATDDQEVVQQGAVHPREETTYDIADEDQEKVGSAENVDAVEGQELAQQDAIDKKGEGTDGTAAEDQDKTVEQCGTYGLGTTETGNAEDDWEAVEQCVIYKEGSAMDDNAVKSHEVVGPTAVDGMRATMVDVSAKYQEKKARQCATYDSETIENDDALEDQEVVEQGVVYREGLAIDHDDSIEDHEVVEQSILEGMPAYTDDIAVEDKKKVVEQCVVHKPRATKDDYTVEKKEKVVEQGAIDKQGATNKDVAVKDQDELMKQHIIDNQGTVPMDDIVVKDADKAAAQYASDAIITYRDVEEHNKVGNQGVIDENVRTKDDIDVEEHDYLKEQVMVDNWGTFSDATALEDQKNEAKLCNVDEQIAGKDVHIKRSMLAQRTGGKQGATKSDFTVEKHKGVVERVCHEWGAPDDDLAMDTAASQSIREISSSEVFSATANGSDWGTGKKEEVKLPIRYPQRPGKLNCPFYMSNGSCSYGFSCQFHHPPLKAKPDGSWCPSEQGNHGVVELNRIGLPIREGARNCTYYMRNGACRYGKHCHFNHPEHVIDAQFYAPTGWEDNALQLEKSSDHATLDDTSHLKKSSDGATLDDTSYSNKFSDHATFNDTSYSKKSSDHATLDDTSHLKKSSDGATLDDTSYSKKFSDHATLDDTSFSKKSSDHATLDDMSCSSEVLPPKILRMLLPPQKVLPSTQGKVMQVKKDSNWSSTSDDSDDCCSADSSDGPLCKQEHVDSSDGPLCKQDHVDYPERPGEPECPFYMKKRFCKFGAQCMFNHPKDSNPTTQSPTNAKKSATSNEHHQSSRITLEDHMPQQQQYPERPGQPDCRYYLQFGECKFLSACIFHHPRDGLPVGWNPSGPAHSDQIGPETHGMPECPFYMKTGKCHFGSACEFRHPKDICSTTGGAFGHRTDLACDDFTRPENAMQKQEQTMYPERPGEPRCFNYMRHGTCRFQMNCKYHHPADRLSTKQYDSTYH